MNYKYIQAAPNSDGSVRFQVVTDAFPLGYMSGNCGVDESPSRDECFVPSMRGSGRLYVPCEVEDDVVVTINGDYLCDVVTMEDALSAPSPAYSANEVSEVTQRVIEAMEAAKAGRPKPALKTDTQDLASKIASAIVAVLREAGIGSK